MAPISNMFHVGALCALALALAPPTIAARVDSAIVLDRFLAEGTDAYIVDPDLSVSMVTARAALQELTTPVPPVDTAANLTYSVDATGKSGIYQRFTSTLMPMDWSGVEAVTFWLYNAAPAPAGSGITLVMNLVDGFECVELCEDLENLQIWTASVALLDVAPEWTLVEVPMSSFALTAGPLGRNDVLDPMGIKSWGLTVVGTGTAGSGSFMVGKPSAVGPTLFGHQLGRREASWNNENGWFRLFSADSAATSAETKQKVYPNGVDGMDTPVFELDYLVERTQAWGGFLDMQHTLPGELVYDLSEATHLTFNINVLDKTNPSGRLHLRVILYDVSNCVGPHCVDQWQTEVYFSFNFVLDYEPGWNKVELPLVGSGSFDDPFVRTGWVGQTGNDRLDKDAIKGFNLEFSAGTNGEMGSMTTGKVQFSDFTVESGLPPAPAPAECRTTDEFVLTGGAFYEIEFGQQYCCEICSDNPRCVFFQVNDRLCMLFDRLDTEYLELKTNTFATYTLGWNNDVIPKACEGPDAPCTCTGDVVDCQNAGLLNVPRLTGPAGTAKELDLRGNSNITAMLPGMLAGAPGLQRIDLRNTGLEVLDAAGIPDSVTIVDVNLTEMQNVASTAAGRGKQLGDVCCKREALPFNTSDGAQLFSCSTVEDWRPCVDCTFIPYHTYEAERKPLAIIRPNDLFGDGANSAENCGELCTRTEDCTHFTWDGRYSLSEPVCYLLSRGEGLAKYDSDGYWQEPGNPSLPGFISGFIAATRALVSNATVSLETPLDVAASGFNFTITPEGKFTANYTIKLDGQPMRGAVWVTPSLRFLSPALAESRGVTASVSPEIVVIYPDEWEQEHVVTVWAEVDPRATGALDAEITHAVESCDEGFELEPTQPERLRLPLRITLYTPVEDRNLSSMVKAFSFVLFGISLATALGFLVWALVNKSHPVVGASQPMFLAMIALGGVVTSFAIVPATFDDTNDVEGLAREGEYELANLGCNLLVWFYSLGFVLTFAPLFAKTWRLSRIVNRKDLKRVKISNMQVAAICAGLVLLEAAIIIGWNVAAPLYYQREVTSVDEVGNALESVGLCRSDADSTPFLATLVVFHLVILMFGMYIINSVKNLESTVLSEGYYVKLTLFSNLQVLALSVPLLIIVAEEPVSTMFLRSGAVFLTNMCGLILIFYPKIKAWSQNLTDVLKSSQTMSSEGASYNKHSSKAMYKPELSFSEHSRTHQGSSSPDEDFNL